MANYFVTNTARFNPFTYQEILAPIVEATKQQYALEEAISSIDDGTLASYLAGESQDSPYVKGYNDLTDRTRALSEQLAANGISPNLMRDALRLKGDFKKFSTPVEAAGKRKASDIATYNKMYASDPTLIGDNPNERSLQWYIDNPTYSPQYTSGRAFQSYGATLGAQLASQFSPTYKPVQGGKFYEVQTKRTATMDEIKNNPEYKTAVDNIMISQGFDPSNNDSLTARVRNEIESGMYMGMQDAGITRISNPGWGRTSSSGNTSNKEKVLLEKATIGDKNYKITQSGSYLIKTDNDGNSSFVTNKEREGLGLPVTGGSNIKRGQQVTHTFAIKPSLDGHVVKDRPSLDVNNDYKELRQINFDLDIEDSDTAIDEYFASEDSPKLTDASYRTLAGALRRKVPSNNREKYELLKDATESGIYIEISPISRKGEQHIYLESLKEKSIHNQQEDDEDYDIGYSEVSTNNNAPKREALEALAEAVRNEGKD